MFAGKSLLKSFMALKVKLRSFRMTSSTIELKEKIIRWLVENGKPEYLLLGDYVIVGSHYGRWCRWDNTDYRLTWFINLKTTRLDTFPSSFPSLEFCTRQDPSHSSWFTFEIFVPGHNVSFFKVISKTWTNNPAVQCLYPIFGTGWVFLFACCTDDFIDPVAPSPNRVEC